MKTKNLIITCFMIIAMFQCSKKAQVVYNIPNDIPPNNKSELLRILDQGKHLYKLNCSSCHGIFTSGMDNIPNFSKEQFDNYSSKVVLQNEKVHGNAKNLSPEELNSILIFLTLVKRNPK